MDWLTGIQKAVDYIEDNLTEEINYEEVAKRASCSNFYFQKLFGIVFGMTLGDYIRNRRLSLAGNELSSTDCKVIDVALKYGYESPESFSRAFFRFHGITPSEAKKDGSGLKYFYRLSVKVTLSGGNTMNYKIVDMDEFEIIERSEPQSRVEEESQKSIQKYWEKSYLDGTVDMLFNESCEKNYIFGICYGNLASDDSPTFNYSVAAKWDKNNPVPAGFIRTVIPKRTWAVFECVGPIPEAMQNIWQTIVSEFFPTSVYQPTYEMDIEVYHKGNRNDSNYRSEIWVPVKKI